MAVNNGISKRIFTASGRTNHLNAREIFKGLHAVKHVANGKRGKTSSKWREIVTEGKSLVLF